MDGAGRLARSLRSLGPQADLKAAAIGAVVLLRERLGLPRAPARAAPATRATEPADRVSRALPSQPRRRRRHRPAAARQRRLRHRQGRASRGFHSALSDTRNAIANSAGIPHHDGRHQWPQATDPGRGARDRRRQRPLVAVVPRRRHRARQAESQSLDRAKPPC